jgi:hypothetical protein
LLRSGLSTIAHILNGRGVIHRVHAGLIRMVFVLSARGANSVSELSFRIGFDGYSLAPTTVAVADLLAPRTDRDQTPKRLEPEGRSLKGTFGFTNPAAAVPGS